MYIVLLWDISRTVGTGGLSFTREEDTGWSYSRFGMQGDAFGPWPLRRTRGFRPRIVKKMVVSTRWPFSDT